ncbi:MAG: DUF1697 domain-containing protein [Candidatus Dormiibacterota bacterium]
MATKIALLRAVNVGGNTKVAMSDLRQLLNDLGMKNSRTLLQTGNLVFDSAGTEESELEGALATEMNRRLGLRTDVMVREVSEWLAAIARNPFSQQAKEDPSHLVVVFLKSLPLADSVLSLDSRSGPERVSAWGRQLFATYPDGIGRSQLTMSVIERQLGIRGTARNWNTVLKLAVLAQE